MRSRVDGQNETRSDQIISMIDKSVPYEFLGREIMATDGAMIEPASVSGISLFGFLQLRPPRTYQGLEQSRGNGMPETFRPTCTGACSDFYRNSMLGLRCDN